MKKIISTALTLALAFTITLNAQDKKSEYKFETIADTEATVVKSQGITGTCWSFSSVSFFESEVLRISGKSIDLSEMYNARMVYPEKAKNYVGRNGKARFSEGGLNHDVLKVIREKGIVTEEAYKGKLVNKNMYNHSELAPILESYVKAVSKNNGKHLSKLWLKGFEAILDAYLGDVPEKFSFEGKDYTPESFRDMLKIDADDYIEFTSFDAYEYNSKVILNIPDNWANGSYYNLELNDYQELVVNALKNGYSVAIDTDVSEKTFSSKYGIAIIPSKELSSDEKTNMFINPVKEIDITPEYRQEEFDNYNTTDDHLMHITAILKDQNGTLYFKVKNSWGTNGQGHDGYVYFSESFFKLKSIAVMVHKDAVPKKIKKKLNIK